MSQGEVELILGGLVAAGTIVASTIAMQRAGRADAAARRAEAQASELREDVRALEAIVGAGAASVRGDGVRRVPRSVRPR